MILEDCTDSFHHVPVMMGPARFGPVDRVSWESLKKTRQDGLL